MKKKLSLALAILFTIFTLPINGISVKANDKTYDNIADGTYDITAKALNEKENKPSGAANFINEEAKLIIKDDKAQLQITVPEVEIASIDGIQIEKQEAKIEKKDKSKVYIFSLKKIKKELKSQVQYSVPIMNMVHDVPFRFILEDLDKLPKKPVIETKDEKKEETIKFETIEKNDQSLEKGHTKTVQEGKNGLKELSYKVTFTDGKETHRKLIEEKVIKEPVNKIVLKGTKTNSESDKNDSNKEEADKSDKNDSNKEEVDKSDKDDSNKEEVDKLDKDDSNKEEVDKSDKDDSNKEEINKLDKKNQKKNKQLDPKKLANGVYEAKYSVDYEGDDFTNHFVQPATIEVKNGKAYLEFKHKDTQFISGITRPDGKIEVVEEDESTRVVGFNINPDLSKPVKIGLKMFYGLTHDVDLRIDVDTLKFIQEIPDSKEPKKEPKKDTVIPYSNVKSSQNNNKKVEASIKNLPIPRNAFTINFSIKHENGKDTSVADEFFKKPAMLIEKDGNMYAQLIITNGNMVKNLKTEYGEVNILKVNKDGSIVVQFKVKKDLSNMKLKMLISVPGLYTAEHDAILVFDKNSKTAIKDNEFSLPGNGDNPKLLSFGAFINSGKGFNGLNSSGNDLYHKFGSLSQSNGSHFSGFGSSKMSTPNLNNKLGNTTSSLADGLEKPEFGSAGSDSQNNQVSSNNNPKTGDTSLIWLYGILLVGSLAILVVKLRRRTI